LGFGIVVSIDLGDLGGFGLGDFGAELLKLGIEGGVLVAEFGEFLVFVGELGGKGLDLGDRLGRNWGGFGEVLGSSSGSKVAVGSGLVLRP
jgi:hypothetical protein